MSISASKIAIYAGSFDPMTNGHLDVLNAGLKIVDHVIVAVGIHPGKTPIFSFEERKRLIESVLNEQQIQKHITVLSFAGLLVDVARQQKASVLLRGLRDGTDFDYEMHMAGMNAAMAPDLQTVFIPARPNTRAITATLVRQINAMGGSVESFVPSIVNLALLEKRKKH